MVGLQGSGKTTTSVKLALFLKKRKKKKVLLCSVDAIVKEALNKNKICVSHDLVKIKKIFVSTYQSVSGVGGDAVDELYEGTKKGKNNRKFRSFTSL